MFRYQTIRAVRCARFSRGLATVVNNGGAVPAALHLKTGQTFKGKSFGASTSVFGETVFSTSITSYTESMTDPSYRGQILVFTTPMIGNYGVPQNQAPSDSKDVGVILESKGIQCAAVVVGDVAEKFSHYAAVESIASWCKRHNVPGITGVDTRAVTTLLRDQGTTLGRLAVGADASLPAPQSHEYWDPSLENLVDQVSTKEIYTLNPNGSVKIALLDFGAKANIARSLVRRNAAVTVLPWNFDFNTIRDQYDGLFLSNGPGDPQHCMEAALNLRRTITEWNKPIFGICMGHQIIGMAAGLDAYRMRFGNRGHNQPVLALASSGSIKAGRVYVTSQNHQYALKLQDPFPQGWEPFFINCNDSSVEGIKSTEDSGKRVWGVQFHPESAGGPLDTIEMFSDFVTECKATATVSHQPAFTGVASAKVEIPLNTVAPKVSVVACYGGLDPVSTTMNFFDTYDIARGPTPQPSDENQPSLNEEVNQVIGQLGRFWGGFKKQSQQALEVARKDLGDVVVQAQKEIGKLTASEPQEGASSSTTAGDGAQDQATTSRSVNSSSSSATAGAESKDAADKSTTASTSADDGTPSENVDPPAGDGPEASTSSSSLFSRLQSVIPPNLISTVQSHIPESIKHASENIDVSQISANVLSELQRVQGVTRAQAEEYAKKSEALIREAVKEANEVLKEAVKIIPPDPSDASASGQAGGNSGMVWDGSDMWMLPMDSTVNQASSSSASGAGKEKAVGGQSSESQHAVASRALALLHRLQSDPSIIQHDPEADDNVKDSFAKWREEEIKSKGGIESPEWAEKTGKLLKEVTSLYEIYSSLVPSTLSKEEFWSRYFFRAHQIKHEEERRKALIQATVTESDEDFSWEDDDDEHETAGSQPAVAPLTDKEKLSAEPSPNKSELSPSTRVSMSSADSFDVVSSTNASVVIEGKDSAKAQPAPTATKAAVVAAVAAPVAAAAAVAAAASNEEEDDEDEDDDEEEEEEDDEEEESEDSDWE